MAKRLRELVTILAEDVKLNEGFLDFLKSKSKPKEFSDDDGDFIPPPIQDYSKTKFAGKNAPEVKLSTGRGMPVPDYETMGSLLNKDQISTKPRKKGNLDKTRQLNLKEPTGTDVDLEKYLSNMGTTPNKTIPNLNINDEEEQENFPSRGEFLNNRDKKDFNFYRKNRGIVPPEDIGELETSPDADLSTTPIGKSPLFTKLSDKQPIKRPIVKLGSKII